MVAQSTQGCKKNAGDGQGCSCTGRQHSAREGKRHQAPGDPPGEHATQNPPPVAFKYQPAGQGVQEDVPATEYDPGAHVPLHVALGRPVTPLRPNWPAGHGLHKLPLITSL